ncbi:PilZ domain-containing protein [Candidatus Uhrbacteria bacterium]|nr:PilZ domain-containing protein [Candidatus Uhrbacteria bacterium]
MERSIEADDDGDFYRPRTRDHVTARRREKRKEARVTCALPVQLWLNTRKNRHTLDGHGVVRSLSRSGAQIDFTEWSKRWTPRAGHALALAMTDSDGSPIALDCVVEWRSAPHPIGAKVGVRFRRVPHAERVRVDAAIRRLATGA